MDLWFVFRIIGLARETQPCHENEAKFDNVSKAASASEGASVRPHTPIDVTSMEQVILLLPSNSNIIAGALEVKIHHQVTQAHWQISQLQDIIADISFQYSHVIHGSIQKSV